MSDMSKYQHVFRDFDGRYRVAQVYEKGATNVLEIRDTWLGEQENILLDREGAKALAEVLLRYSATGAIEPTPKPCRWCGQEPTWIEHCGHPTVYTCRSSGCRGFGDYLPVTDWNRLCEAEGR